jgi:hypothetical protein
MSLINKMIERYPTVDNPNAGSSIGSGLIMKSAIVTMFYIILSSQQTKDFIFSTFKTENYMQFQLITAFVFFCVMLFFLK